MSRTEDKFRNLLERLKIPTWVWIFLYTSFGLLLGLILLRFVYPSEALFGISVAQLREALMLGAQTLVLLTVPSILWALFKFERRARKLWSGELGPYCPHCDYDTGDYNVKACPECGEAIERTLPGRRPPQLPAQGSENTP